MIRDDIGQRINVNIKDCAVYIPGPIFNIKQINRCTLIYVSATINVNGMASLKISHYNVGTYKRKQQCKSNFFFGIP